MGYPFDDLSFLPSLRGIIDGFETYPYKRINLSILESLPELKYIGIASLKPSDYPDFSKFTNLKSCELDVWGKNTDSLLHAKDLRLLTFSGYQHANLKALTVFKNLRRLQISNARKITSLDGLEELPKLGELDFYSLSSLTDIKAIGLSKSLRYITFNSCRKMLKLPEFNPENSIEVFTADNTGEIESMLPLLNCRNIRCLSFYESTKALDGKIKVLEDLPNLEFLTFQNRRFYDYKREDFACYGVLPHCGDIIKETRNKYLTWDD